MSSGLSGRVRELLVECSCWLWSREGNREEEEEKKKEKKRDRTGAKAIAILILILTVIATATATVTVSASATATAISALFAACRRVSRASDPDLAIAFDQSLTPTSQHGCSSSVDVRPPEPSYAYPNDSTPSPSSDRTAASASSYPCRRRCPRRKR